MTNPIESILNLYNEGKSVVILSGRDLNDFEPAGENITSILELLRKEAYEKNNLVMIEYSRSTGIQYDLRYLTNDEKNSVTKCLNTFGFTNTKPADDQPEFVRIVRSLIKLSESKNSLIERNGKPLKFLFIFNFSEHLIPQLQSGFHTTDQIVSIETALKLSTSLGVRKYGNYIIFSEAKSGTLDNLMYQNIPMITLPQPDKSDKQVFIETLKGRYPNVKFDSELNEDSIANLSSGTPNRTIESIFLSSEKTSQVITIDKVVEKKQKDIINLSEGTLESIDLSRIIDLNLVGKNIERPLFVLEKISTGLKNSDSSTLKNVLLCGSPSSGKTDLAYVAAQKAGVSSFKLNSPKTGIVGESERKTNLMLSLLKSLGGFGIIDEVELVLPMNRNTQSLDGGVTQNLIGQLQSFLSDSSLSGKCTLIGTSNKPNAVSGAMLSRWTIIPVLAPLKHDYPAIIHSIAKKFNPDFNLEINNSQLVELAYNMFEAGFTPREIHESLKTSQTFIPGDINIEHIEYASKDIMNSENKMLTYHSDYCALAFTRNQSFLPWFDLEKKSPDPDFPYPDYILEVMTDDFQIDNHKLNQKIHELEPYCNV